MISIFIRSYYEDVIATRVHPEYILKQKIPGIDSIDDIRESFWTQRFNQINDFEKMLVENGTIILKFYLNVSEAKQSKRFLKRLRKGYQSYHHPICTLVHYSGRPKMVHALPCK